MIFYEMPEDFEPKIESVICFCQHDGKYLMLQRNEDKIEGGKWGLPGGKVDFREKLIEAMEREIFEETGLRADSDKIEYITKYYVRYPNADYVCHVYYTELNDKGDVRISPNEHQNFAWVEPLESLGYEMMLDQERVVMDFYKISEKV